MSIEIVRNATGQTLTAVQWMPGGVDEVFAFFADAGNLEQLTPIWLKFQILTPAPVAMRAGTVLDYRLRLRGIPLRWQSRISAWEPPHRFVDEQVRGPYRRWVHEHRFIAKDGGTQLEDRVDYLAIGGRLVNALMIAPDLRRIFAFRQRKCAELFGQSGGPTSTHLQ